GDTDDEKLEGLTKRIEKVLDERVKEVRITRRLTASPACLVADEYGMGRHMVQILKASGQQMPMEKPILEINPDHPIVGKLQNEEDENRFGDWANILFEQALLSEGGQLEDPAGFVHRLNSIFLELK
ncbi:MAG: molecular chaperone HtpG, partial [Gammaproteobacteria bacterium]|nr:molecular chaperone HtpG [Gammaproteobacteria bacterium]